jgi:ABC-2 type transport system ATP-binding protein
MIQISGLSVTYGKNRGVDNLNLTIDRGESVLLAGANGSGKTTLLRVISGVLFPNQGDARVDNKKIGPNTRRKTAYIPASIGFYDSLRIRDAITLHGSFYPEFSYKDLAGLTITRSRRVGSLSRGEKTLFFLALALASNPEYLLIDDVVHFLDPHLRELFLKSILQLIEENQLSVIVAAQSSFEIEGIFERIIIMDKGKTVVDENVDALKKKFVKIYSESIPDHLPVVFSRSWQGVNELFLYPYDPGVKCQEKVHHLRLSEILRAFIGGEYGTH